MRDTARVGRRVDSFCAAVDRGPIAAAAVAAAWLETDSAALGSFGTPKPVFPAEATSQGGKSRSGGARARGLEERHERIARVLRQEGLGEVQKAGHRARHLPRG